MINTFSFPLGTEMFHFPRFPTSHLCIQCGFIRHYSYGVSPFGDLRIKGCLPPPRSLSQAATSFFGTFCRAILRMPLLMLYNRFHIRLSRTKRSLILLIHYPYSVVRFNSGFYYILPSDQSSVMRLCSGPKETKNRLRGLIATKVLR